MKRINYGMVVAVASSIFLGLSASDANKPGWNGALYNQGSQPQTVAGRALIENITFAGDEQVLDVGCGTANLAAEIAQKLTTGKVFAIDNDASMVQQAGQAHGDTPNLTVMLASAQELKFKNMFDLVISVFCLHWIPADDLDTTIQCIADSLKPGGRFLAVFNIADHEDHPVKQIRAAQELVDSHKWAEFYKGAMPLGNGCVLNDYDTAVFTAGLEGEVVLSQQPPCSFPWDVCKKIFRAIPLLTHIPEERKEEFLEEVKEKLIGIGMQNEDGTFNMSWTNGMIDVTKPVNDE